MDHTQAIDLVLSGRIDAFSEIIEGYHVAARNYIAMSFPDAARIEELAQETFVRAFRQLPGFDRALPFWPWLRGIARNVVREQIRALQKAAREREAYAEAALLREADRAAEQEDRDEQVEALTALRGCMEKLSERGRRLVRWFYDEGLSSEQIAEQLSVGSSAVRNSLVRVRRTLRDCVRSNLQIEA